MKRLEIFANQSVQEELLTALGAAIEGLRFTLVPVVQGRGGEDWKLGTTVWPEQNFLLVCYLADDQAPAAAEAVRQVKRQYPKEGLKAYTTEAAEEA